MRRKYTWLFSDFAKSSAIGLLCKEQTKRRVKSCAAVTYTREHTSEVFFYMKEKHTYSVRMRWQTIDFACLSAFELRLFRFVQHHCRHSIGFLARK